MRQAVPAGGEQGDEESSSARDAAVEGELEGTRDAMVEGGLEGTRDAVVEGELEGAHRNGVPEAARDRRLEAKTTASGDHQAAAAAADWRTRLVIWLVAAIFLVPAGLHCVSRLPSHLLGIDEVDHYGTQWFYWYVEHQLRNHESFVYTDLMFYPYGKDIFLHTGSNVLDAYLAVPFRVIFGHVLGYNLFVLTALALSAWAFFRLAREFTSDRLALWVSTFFFAFSPFILYETAEGRPTQSILGLLPLFLLYVWRTGRQRGLRSPLWAGFVLAVAGFQYWFYAFFGGLVCLAHGLWRALLPPPDAGGRIRILSRHAVIALVSLGLCAPMAVPLLELTTGDSSEVPGLLDTKAWSLTNSTPVTAEGQEIALLVWQPWMRQSGFYVRKDGKIDQFLPHQNQTSWTALVLLAVYLFRPGRLDRGAFLVMAGVAAMIALGPIVMIGNQYLPNMVYIYLAKSLGFFQRLWWPARAYAFLTVLGAVAATMAIAWIGTHGKRVQAAAVLLLSVAWVWELQRADLVPFPAWDATVPSGYRCLAGGEPGAVIELPYSWTQAHLYYQTAHGRPILGGMVEDNPLFSPPESLLLRKNNTYLYSLLSVAKLEATMPPWTESDKQALHKMGYRYVVLQKDAFRTRGSMGLTDNAQRTHFRRMGKELEPLLGQPIYNDARINLYAPWGDPLPCDVRKNGVDRDPFRPELALQALGYRKQDAVPIFRVIN